MNKILQSDNKNPTMQKVKAAMKNTKDKRMFERYQSILLHLKGMTYEQIAGITNRSSVTIGSYVKAYREKGLDGLQLGQSPGRPSFLTEEQEQELYQLIIERRPADVGFPAEMNWNAPLIREWIEREYDVIYAERGVRKLLCRLGFSYTKPTYTLAKADPEKQAAFREEFETIKKNDEWRN
jgi:transposase